MDSRYDQLKKVGARNIKEYNEMFINKQSSVGRYDYMPYIVVIIDEFGDLMMTVGKEVEQLYIFNVLSYVDTIHSEDLKPPAAHYSLERIAIKLPVA